jgi:GAF domain-containing protein
LAAACILAALPQLFFPFFSFCTLATAPLSNLSAEEAARLRSLRAAELLPALTEPVFNEFVALTARIFSLPISLISVVEETDVYYPANVGMPGHNQQPRIEALCATAIAQQQAVVYHDLVLEEHPEIPDEALRAAETNGLRFYAGALLRLPDQRPLGTLCVIDRAPRTFTAEEQRILELLAALVSRAVAVRHLCRLHPKTGDAQWARLSAELEEEVQALNALVRYLTARHGTMVPVPAAFLTQVESRLRDLQALLDAFHPAAH